ncbi:TRAP transporter large permease subunit, partial [Thermus sp.]|uniref:TRAP transporter large permease subunit n=1 Tax=Thermus sp. TaxID=275 RepID=UPI00307F3D67
MPIELLTWLMFGSLFLLLLTGYPLAFLTGGLAVLFIAGLWSPEALSLLPQRVWNNMTQYLLAAIPLFIFMASMLEKSGLIEEIFDVAQNLHLPHTVHKHPSPPPPPGGQSLRTWSSRKSP